MTDDLLVLRAQLERARQELSARLDASERLERRLADARRDARVVAQQNEKLNVALREARTALLALRERVNALGQPPATFGVLTAVHVADAQADVSLTGRALRVTISPDVDAAALRVGEWVLLNEAMTIVGVAPAPTVGDAVRVREVLASGQVVVSTNGDEEIVMLAAPSLDATALQPGDALLADRRVGLAWARLDRSDVEDLELLEVPDVTYADIGGLAEQIDEIRDAVELPFAHRDLFAQYGLAAPKGILLYGPPGCGKTMIAKAVANAAGSAFLNVKGPELLNKYVGETERQIRQIFARARELAGAGRPVIVFFDEMDSLFRTRGTGISSDVESTIVPQLLAEIDGVETLSDVIVIGATNREDLIDPAILRPGRLDVKIKLARPTRAGAAEILRTYLDASLPLDADEAAGDADELRERLVEAAVERLYARTDANAFVEVTYASGTHEVLHVCDFVSGAMLANVVARAKKAAIKDVLAGGAGGLRVAHMVDACAAEVAENEELPNTTNPDDWARISGRKGERIVFLRTLHDSRALAV